MEFERCRSRAASYMNAVGWLQHTLQRGHVVISDSVPLMPLIKVMVVVVGLLGAQEFGFEQATEFMPKCGAIGCQFGATYTELGLEFLLTIESQEPVHNDIASLETPKQLTLLSWPWSVPTRSPRRVSQTLIRS